MSKNDPKYQVINARYKSYDRYLRRREPRGGKAKHPIFLGPFRLPPNTTHPFHMRLSDLVKYRESVEMHLRAHDIFLLDERGQQIRDPRELYGPTAAEREAEKDARRTQGEPPGNKHTEEPLEAAVVEVMVHDHALSPDEIEEIMGDHGEEESEEEGEQRAPASEESSVDGDDDDPTPDEAPAGIPEDVIIVDEVAEFTGDDEAPEGEGRIYGPADDMIAAVKEGAEIQDDTGDAEEQVVEEEVEDPPEYDLSLLELSVSKLERALADVEDVRYLKTLLSAEEANKARKSAMAFLSEVIDELEET